MNTTEKFFIEQPALWDCEAEMSVVHRVLVDNVALIEAARLLRPEHFFNHDLGLLFKTAIALTPFLLPSENPAAQVRQKLIDQQQWTGTMSEIFSLVSSQMSYTSLLSWYAKRVWDKYQLRQFVNFGIETIKDAYRIGAKPEEMLSRCSDLFHSTERPGTDDGTFGDIAKAILEPDDPNASGVKTGLCDLDSRLQGIRKGEIIVLGARPSAGKTAIALQIAGHVALDLNIRTAYFTLESDKQTLVERIASQRTGVPFYLVRQRKIKNDDAERVRALMQVLMVDWPLKLFDVRRFSADDFEAYARRLAALESCGFIIVDYVQRMAWPQGCREKRIAVESNCRSIVDLAGVLKIPIMIISQLNRMAEGVEPGLEHLSESGTIEADADIILLLHRPDRAQVKTLAILAKQRNAMVSKFDLVWDGEHVRFLNATKQYTGMTAGPVAKQGEFEQPGAADDPPQPF
jgi:replicative DNA helicase